MKRFMIAAIACLLWGSGAASTANAQDSDDLEVTMQVFDDLTEVDNSITSLRRPRRRSDVGTPDEEPGAEGEQEMRIEPGSNDRFEHNDVDENDRERALESEHEIEDGEEVDYDQYDIIDDMG